MSTSRQNLNQFVSHHTAITDLWKQTFLSDIYVNPYFMFFQSYDLFFLRTSLLVDTIIMAKKKIAKNCYQSATGSRKPKCRQSNSSFCPSCLTALMVYEQCKAAKKVIRMQKNREASNRSKMRREERFSDIYSENIALTTEHEDLTLDLAVVTAARDAMSMAVAAKLHQLAAMI